MNPPIRSTVESPAIPTRYTKTILNVQTPTESTRPEITIFPDFNDNTLDNGDQSRPDRKTQPLISKEKTGVLAKVQKVNETEDKNLRYFTAIPTSPTTTIDGHHYQYDPKTTPNYKKYSYTVVDSDTDSKQMSNPKKNAKEDAKTFGKTDPDTTTVTIVYSENVNKKVPNVKKKSHPFDYHYRIIPEISTIPAVSPLKDSDNHAIPLNDGFKLIKQSLDMC